MTSHQELIAEMTNIERMSNSDRIKYARKKRAQQLKRFQTYEKSLAKELKRSHGRAKGRKLKTAGLDKHGIDADRSARFQRSIMLLEAASRCDLDEVRSLLDIPVDADVCNEDGLTALHQSCIEGYEDMVRLLISYNANVNSRDNELWTPLHAAATCANLKCCSLLVNAGADLLAVNADGNMPYDICDDEATLDFLENRMAANGVTQEMIDELRGSIESQMLRDIKAAYECGGDLNYRDNFGATPLHVSVANGYVEVAEFLLKSKKVSIGLRDNDSWMPIHAAAYWCQPYIFELLLIHGAHLEAKTKYGETPYDLCQDPDFSKRIEELREPGKLQQLKKTRITIDPSSRSSQMQRSLSRSRESLFRSVESLNERRPSGSVRRSSVREKSRLSHRAAIEERVIFKEAALHNESFDENSATPAATQLQTSPPVSRVANVDEVSIKVPTRRETLIDDVTSARANQKNANNINGMKNDGLVLSVPHVILNAQEIDSKRISVRTDYPPGVTPPHGVPGGGGRQPCVAPPPPNSDDQKSTSKSRVSPKTSSENLTEGSESPKQKSLAGKNKGKKKRLDGGKKEKRKRDGDAAHRKRCVLL